MVVDDILDELGNLVDAPDLHEHPEDRFVRLHRTIIIST